MAAAVPAEAAFLRAATSFLLASATLAVLAEIAVFAFSVALAAFVCSYPFIDYFFIDAPSTTTGKLLWLKVVKKLQQKSALLKK